MYKLKETKIINKIIISLLVMLLLLSPCSVKNYLESTLGLETTKPLNPSKSNSSASLNYCVVLENAIQENEIASDKKQIKGKQIQNISSFLVLLKFDDKVNFKLSENNSSPQIIPYYILYKRLNVNDNKNVHLELS